jgi:hypothetical protein
MADIFNHQEEKLHKAMNLKKKDIENLDKAVEKIIDTIIAKEDGFNMSQIAEMVLLNLSYNDLVILSAEHILRKTMLKLINPTNYESEKKI